MVNARAAALAVVLSGLLAACDRSAEDPLPIVVESDVGPVPELAMLWAEGTVLATGSWPEAAYLGELDSPVSAIAVINGQLLAATDDGVIRQFTKVPVAAGGRLAATRRVQPGCRVEAMAGRDDRLWVLFRACEDQGLWLGAINPASLSLVMQRQLEADHGGPAAMALGDEHLFVMRSDPFELIRVRLSDLAPDGRVDLRQGARPAYGYGELLVVNELIWVIDRYRDHLIQVRPQGPGIELSRTFASMGMPGPVKSCQIDGERTQVYCLVGAAMYVVDPQPMRSRRLLVPAALSQAVPMDEGRLLLGAAGQSFVWDLGDATSAVVEHGLPDLIVPVR